MSEQTDKKNEKPKISFRRIISNNLFMLKLLHKASPGRIAIEMGLWILEAIIGFFSWQYMLRHIVNGIEEGKGFYDLASLLIAMTLLNVQQNTFKSSYIARRDLLILLAMKTLIFTISI